MKGVVLLTGVAGVALALEVTLLPGELSSVTIAIALGLLVGNTLRPTGAGLEFAARRLLPLAIVLVGLRLPLREVASVSADALVVAIVAITAGLVVALTLGRALGIGTRLATLIAIGTAICGNTAIVGAAPILRARRDEVAYAIATITAFGTLAIFVFPLAGEFAGMGDRAFGLWAGAGVHDTSQVLATSFAYSDEAGETATVVKLARNAFIGPMLLAIALLAGRGAAPGVRRVVRLPWFVWGFVACVLVASTGAVPSGTVSVATDTAHVLILLGIAAIGMTIDMRAMREAGPRPFLLGLAAMSAVSMLVLATVNVFNVA